MYESPISLTEKVLTDAFNAYDAAVENELTRKIRFELNIDIDKEELLKALRYDRGQYDAGYESGYNDGYDTGFHDAVEHLKNAVEEIYKKQKGENEWVSKNTKSSS